MTRVKAGEKTRNHMADIGLWAGITPFAMMAAMIPVEAAAQDKGGDKVITRYYNPEEVCDQSEAKNDPNTIVVCVPLENPYRIPKDLRQDPNDPVNQSWTQRVRSDAQLGETGAESCSTVGPGGMTGCLQKDIQNAIAERRTGSDAQAGKLIEEARRERLETIDEEAVYAEERDQEVAEELDASRAQREAAAAAMAAEAEATGAGLNTQGLTVPPIDNPATARTQNFDYRTMGVFQTGMTLASAMPYLMPQGKYSLRDKNWDSYNCEIYTSADGLVELLSLEGRVDSMTTKSPSFVGKKGLKVGVSEQQLLELWGNSLVTQEDPNGNGTNYFLPAEGGLGYKYHVENDVVTEISVGDRSIRFSEGCM